MDKLFFWNPYHNGDIIFTRPLVRAVLDRHDVEITWGCFCNHKYLIQDLPVRVLTDPRDDRLAQDLTYLCPFDHFPINTWIGQYPETRRCIWSSFVGAYNRQVEARGLAHLAIVSRLVPMVDFPDVDLVINENSVYVSNSVSRSGQSDYVMNMQALSMEFPALTFYCTANPGWNAPNMVDCSRLNLVQLSAISNRCDAIIGKAGGAIDCAFTEINRFKPRAIMGLSDPHNPTIWNYPGLRVSYLQAHEQLKRFLQEVMSRSKPRLPNAPVKGWHPPGSFRPG